MEICIFEIAPFGQRSSPRFFGAVPEGWASRQRPEGKHLGGQRPMLPTLPCSVTVWRDELGRNGTNVPCSLQNAPTFGESSPFLFAVPRPSLDAAVRGRDEPRFFVRRVAAGRARCFLDVGKAVYNLRTSGEKRNFAGQRLCASRFGIVSDTNNATINRYE